MTAINKNRQKRLEMAMFELKVINAKYASCPNPDMNTITFAFPNIKEGQSMRGAAFFDFRKQYTQALFTRGFHLHMDNQGANPCELLVKDFIADERADGEILGLDNNGCLLQWNADDLAVYNCGETPEEFGLHNIRPHERERIANSVFTVQ